ncbi:MAG TPA: sigma-70 family RNA polymerase sigma factor [Planctomycetota bacterium]|nr:sigma-70 family RNA polymerase sigma factor [Planctomycetota bacterium]
MHAAPDPSDADTAEALFLRFAKGGDRAALDRLLRLVADRTYTQALRITGDPHLAEEAVQEAWLRLIATAPRYDGGIAFAAWLGRLVCAAAIDQRRSARRRRERREDAMPEPAARDPGDAESIAAVRDAVEALPERYRRPVLLHYFAGLTQEEAAQALSVPPGTIAAQLSRARDRLRVRLGRAGFALSAAAILNLLTAQPSHAAPASLVASLATLHGAAATTASATGGVTLASWAAGIVLMGSLVGGAVAVLGGAPTDRPPVGEVVIAVGDDLQAAVDAHPPGTRYRLLAGVHRLQQVRPKDGDVFQGDEGAIMSGARVIADAVPADGHWVARAQDQQGQVHGRALPGRAGAVFAEDCLRDGRPLRHVRDRAALEPGTFLFDYDADTVHLADDPAGHVVEIGVARCAFAGSAQGVVLRDLVIEGYANPAQMGAIGDQEGVVRWTIERCVIRHNHGTGVAMRDGSRLLDCTVTGNGQQGVCGSGDGLVVDGCRITGNNHAGFDPGWEAGGAKFGACAGLLVRGTSITGNHGAGLITEGATRDTTIAGNHVVGNAREGIAHKQGRGALIAGNHVAGNGSQDNGWAWGAQILVRNSADVRVQGNRVVATDPGADGIVIMEQDETPRATGSLVSGNAVLMTSPDAFCGACTDTGRGDCFATNVFDGNRYIVPDPAALHWAWLDRPMDWDGFRAAGNEPGGVIVIGTSLPDIEVVQPR